jgi:hypothetical protein
MNRQVFIVLTGVALSGVVALAQPAPAPTPTPATETALAPVSAEGPTPKNPVRFSAFAVSMQQGQAGQIDIAIERWTTDDERKELLGLLAGTEFRSGGQDKLLEALQAIQPRVGFIRTPKTMGWDLKYAWQSALPDGTRQIVIATDKPVSFLAASNSGDVLNYPFTLIEIRMGKDDTGEGRLLAATAVSVENGKLELKAYGLEPIKLTQVTETQKKPKPPKEK